MSDCSVGQVCPLLGDHDPLFWSPQYEEDLLNTYLPMGIPSRAELLSPSKPSTPESDYDALEDPDISPWNEIEEYSPEYKPDADAKRKRSARYDTPTPTRRIQTHTIKRRGRPTGSKSNSKMALYAKQYRESKKEETKQLAQEVSTLTQENASLISEMNELRRMYAALSKENKDMRRNSVNAHNIRVLLDSVNENPSNLRLVLSPANVPYIEVLHK